MLGTASLYRSATIVLSGRAVEYIFKMSPYSLEYTILHMLELPLGEIMFSITLCGIRLYLFRALVLICNIESGRVYPLLRK